MKAIRYYAITIALLLLSSAYAQEVNLSYTVDTHSEGTTVKVYAESTSQSTKDIAAFNASFVFGEGCEAVGKVASMLEESWTDYLEKTTNKSALNIRLAGQSFSKRLQWGIADPDLPQTSIITVPPQGQPVLMLTQNFTGACKDVYLEHVSENALNEIGNVGMKPMAYTIQHPDRPVKPTLTLALQAYPIPTVDFVQIMAEGFEAGVYDVEILDIMGRSLFSEERSMDVGEELTVDLSKLSEGVYIISLKHTLNAELAAAARVVKK